MVLERENGTEAEPRFRVIATRQTTLEVSKNRKLKGGENGT